MNNRTMTTVYVDRDSISLKTRSRSGCSPQHFIILKKELQRLEEKKYLITKDIHSYAELRLCDAVGGAKVLELSFTWLKDAGRNSVSGYTEQVRLPYEPFRVYAAGEEEVTDGTRWRFAIHSGTEQAKAGVSQPEKSQGRSGESYPAAQTGEVSGSAF